jgi:hypothetical protein
MTVITPGREAAGLTEEEPMSGSETELPAGLLAMLTAEPPRDLLGLALRWIPVDTVRAYRIAAAGCAEMRGARIDLTARKPKDDPAAQVTGDFRLWLSATRDGSAEETALRIFSLHFACQRVPPDAGPRIVTEAAGVLYRWFSAGRWS